MKTPFLIGPRLYFRPLEREDAPQLAAFINDPAVRRTLLMHRPMSVGQEVAWLEGLGKDEHHIVLGIARQSDDVLIGTAGLHRLDYRSHLAEFGLALGVRSAWGQGFGSEATRMTLDYAFGTLNLNRVWLQVYASHAAAIRVYGEGRLPQGRRAASAALLGRPLRGRGADGHPALGVDAAHGALCHGTGSHEGLSTGRFPALADAMSYKKTHLWRTAFEQPHEDSYEEERTRLVSEFTKFRANAARPQHPPPRRALGDGRHHCRSSARAESGRGLRLRWRHPAP